MRRSLAAAAGAIALAAFATPSVTLASCVMIPDVATAIRQAEVVFVGTVTSTEGDGRWAHVSVEEVWAGPDQRATVVVVGALDQSGVTSVDRFFTVGARYLFLPRLGENGGLTDNACSATAEWDEAMVALRPATVREPTGIPAGVDSGPGALLVPAGVAIAVALVLLLVGLAVRSRQSA